MQPRCRASNATRHAAKHPSQPYPTPKNTIDPTISNPTNLVIYV